MTKKKVPAHSREQQENRLVAHAMDAAEKRFDEGTASSQLIVHYLKLGTVREKLQLERMQNENLLLQAKIKAIEATQQKDVIFESVLSALKKYNRFGVTDEEV